MYSIAFWLLRISPDAKFGGILRKGKSEREKERERDREGGGGQKVKRSKDKDKEGSRGGRREERL